MATPKPRKTRTNRTQDPKEWRATFQGALAGFLQDRPAEREKIGKLLELGKSGRLWQRLTDAKGKTFETFEAFCLHPKPEGLGSDPEDVRHLLLRFLPKTKVARLTAPVARQGKKSSTHGVKKKRDDRDRRSRDYAPQIVHRAQDLGLLGWREVDKFAVKNKSPERRKAEKTFESDARKIIADYKKRPDAKDHFAKRLKTKANAHIAQQKN